MRRIVSATMLGRLFAGLPNRSMAPWKAAKLNKVEICRYDCRTRQCSWKWVQIRDDLNM